MYQIIQSAQPARTYIMNGHYRHEVIIHETYTDEQGVRIAKVQYVADILPHVFEVEFSRIHTEAE